MTENYKNLVDMAYKMHVEGKLEDAKAVYEKLLAMKPDDLDVQSLYAQLNLAMKNYDVALELFESLYEQTQLPDMMVNAAKVHFFRKDYEIAVSCINAIQYKNLAALRLLALSYSKLNNEPKAIETYLELIKLQDINYSDYLNLSISYLKNNEMDKALEYAQKAYSLNEKDISVNLQLASIYDKNNDYEHALNHLLFVSQVKPDVDLLYRIGVLYKKLKNDEMAVAYFNAILDVDPFHKNALLNIAIIFKNHDKNVTIEIFNKLLEKYPDDEHLIEQMFFVYLKMQNFNEALIAAEKLININPFESNYLVYAADVLVNLFRYDESLEYYKRALESYSNPDYVELQIAYIYSYTNRDDEAREILHKHLDLKGARVDLAFLECRNRNLEAVREYMHEHLTKVLEADEIDDKVHETIYALKLDKKFGIDQDVIGALKDEGQEFILKRQRAYLEKNFHNKDITGKRVLLYSNNGMGDLFMFARYIHRVIEKASKVLIQVPNNCRKIFETSFPQAEFIKDDILLEDSEYDYSSSVFQLLTNLDVSLNDIEGNEGYLFIDNQTIKEKSEFDFMQTNKKKVGLFWQGNPTLLTNRSIKLEKLKPLFDLNNIQYYSFQITKIDFESEELKQELPIIDLATHIKSYADTAGFLKNIDTLVTIDTSIANLAGAMGIKTYLLLPYATEWRWFKDSDKTPWYDSVKIFKQKVPNDWDEVVQRVKNELQL